MEKITLRDALLGNPTLRELRDSNGWNIPENYTESARSLALGLATYTLVSGIFIGVALVKIGLI